MKMLLMMTVLFVATGMTQDRLTPRVKLWLLSMIIVIVLYKYTTF